VTATEKNNLEMLHHINVSWLWTECCRKFLQGVKLAKFDCVKAIDCQKIVSARSWFQTQS